MDDNDIARLVFGSGAEPPNWLVPSVEKARLTLNWSTQKEGDYPTRTELRKTLKTLQAAVDCVRKNMRDLTVSTILLNGDNQFKNQNETYYGLGDITDRAQAIIDLIPKGPGRYKFYTRPDGLSPQVNCALMISIIWEQLHGKFPPNTNNRAQQACAALWTAAGGPSLGHWGATADGQSVVVWRDHLKDAKRAATSEEATSIKRSLIDFPMTGETKPSRMPVSPLYRDPPKDDQ